MVEVIEIEESIRIDPDKFIDETINIQEYVGKLRKQPSLAFSAFQRVYTALRMFGKTDSDKPGKADRWNFLDDRVIKPNKKPGMGSLYGVEDVAEAIMTYLEDACVSTDTQGRFILLYGPPSSAKTNLIELMSDAVDAYTSMEEGAVYTVRWNLSGLAEHFGGLEQITCPSHENPVNFIQRDELDAIMDEVNENLSEWQKLYPRTTRCPTCNFIIRQLRKLCPDEDFRDRIQVVRLFPRIDVNRYEFRPTAEKAYDPTLIFGGAVNYARLSRFMRRDHPLVLNYGIGGTIDGPSPQHHIVHFSEMYKGGEEFLNEMLDLVQSRSLMIRGKYEVPVDSLFIGTTNLEEFEKMKKLPELAEYLTSRSYPIGMGYLLVLDDQTKAIEKRIFKSNDRRMTYHIPPHFIEEVLSPIAVLGALDEPKSELKLTLLQKAEVYNGEMPHGLEYNLDELYWELFSEAHHKPSSEITEGVRQGIPFRFFQELPIKFAYAISKLPKKIKREYPSTCVGMLTIKPLLESIMKKYDGMSEETRSRVIKEALPIAWDLYEEQLARDVNKAILGESRIINIAVKYLIQAYESLRNRDEYVDLRGKKHKIDKEFMEDIEKASGIANGTEFRRALAEHIKYRRGDFMEDKDGDKIFAADELAKRLLDENPTFRRAIEGYAIKRILPNLVDDISMAYSSANEPLIKELEGMGYCQACASIAIQAAARKRKTED